MKKTEVPVREIERLVDVLWWDVHDNRDQWLPSTYKSLVALDRWLRTQPGTKKWRGIDEKEFWDESVRLRDRA